MVHRTEIIDPEKPWVKRVIPESSGVVNVGSVAMELALQGDWDKFEACLDRFDDSQLDAFVKFYGDLNHEPTM